MSEIVKKILALDVGSQNVGVALGDFARLREGFMPQSLQAFAMPQSNHAFCKCVFALVRKYRIDTLVLGYPLSSANVARDLSALGDDAPPKSYSKGRDCRNHLLAKGEESSHGVKSSHLSQKHKNPKNPKGRRQIRALARRIKDYVAAQQKKEKNAFPFRVLLQDEHLTTYSAKQSPFFVSMTPKNNNLGKKAEKSLFSEKNIDSFAACEILLSCVSEMIQKKQ